MSLPECPPRRAFRQEQPRQGSGKLDRARHTLAGHGTTVRGLRVDLAHPGAVPHEVAAAAAFLASPGAGWTTGTIMNLDGADADGALAVR
ncbi:hypothetical protein [Streptomyces sp. Inha503]|uniref:hypothetical protein n=1 Tax=Streptomyces sp. Inha503 TaxID=3383314 RepID=UPI0039A27773